MQTATEKDLLTCRTSKAVLKFMAVCSEERSERPGFNAKTGLWVKLVREEFIELLDALDKAMQVADAIYYAEILDGVCDLVWVTIGLAHNMGLPFDEAFEEVRKTNMLKVDPITGRVARREDGKILKPAGWLPPDILSLVKERLK